MKAYEFATDEASAGRAGGRTHFLDGADVDRALGTAGRVYLVGHLGLPQPLLEHIGCLDSPVEVGVTRYDRPTADRPHMHRWNVDIVFVIRGSYAMRNLGTGEARVLTEGGLYAVEPNTPHACVAAPGTEVLFVKVPGGNDKVEVELDPESERWVQQMVDGAMSHPLEVCNQNAVSH